ncbi:calmodulin mutant SYNCAM35 [Neocallimastix lanati (nom. inval.)]|jgi:calmodulin|uniref:Putative calmodulin n=1 Tax=Neocallimastix californiae TaxID=1754190 RepID=A0A1Y2AJ32_9FUNG|nr:calmodulin mutant SYNCAM35 [Neocallimastix sp. JGI-2020a]ORY22310.1 putative calmodulin [Neocallimastix californiae]|eukprot:ORY22310.1 putative calmodulin [Neocallimastix californiae]
MADQLSEEQIAQFKEAFSLFDKEGSNTIETSELGTVLRALGLNLSQAEVNKYVKEVDTGNGKVGFPEFLTLCARTMKTQPSSNDSEAINKAFQVFDSKNSGSISAKEFRHILTHIGEKLTDEEITQVLKDAGIADDGKITLEAFTKMLNAN